FRAELGSDRYQPPGTAAAGHGLLQPPAERVAGRDTERDAGGIQSAERRRRVSRGVFRPVARARTGGAELRHRLPALARVHVSDPGGVVRNVAPPDHNSAVAAADAAVRAAVNHPLPSVAEYLLCARSARALRRGEEELDSSDRSRQPAEG